MLGLESRIGALIKNAKLILPGETVVVGVSGGPDSMALLHLLAGLAGPGGFTLRAVYVDHGLRPAETPREAALVRTRAALLGVDCRVERADVRGRARAAGLSLEHAGRLLRYEIFTREAESQPPWKIAVAHTADDQAEELLLRLLRGTGRKGLAGMAMVTERGVVRPLLEIPKAEVLDYLAREKIPYLEDSSNRDRRYRRNQVRLDLLPYLEAHFNPAVRETLRRTAAILAEEEQLLAATTAKAWPRVIRGQATPTATVVTLQPLLGEPLAIRRRLLEGVLLTMGGQPTFHQIGLLLQLAEDGQEGKILHLARGLRVTRQGGELRFAYPAGITRQRGDLLPAASPSFEARLAGPGELIIPELGLEIVCKVLGAPPAAAELQRPDLEFLDLATISFPLLFRSPIAGDRFQPLGAPGTKKLSDIFINRKIARGARNGPVLQAGARIVAVLGVGVAHHARLTAATKKVLRISWRRR